MAPRGKDGGGGRGDANNDRSRECAHSHPDDERRYRKRSRVGVDDGGTFMALVAIGLLHLSYFVGNVSLEEIDDGDT